MIRMLAHWFMLGGWYSKYSVLEAARVWLDFAVGYVSSRGAGAFVEDGYVRDSLV